jgi:adenylate kinase
MRLLIVAAPGAGKGTQAERLAVHYEIAHLSSGDLFRKAVAEGSEIGKEAAAYLDRGDLVPDEVVIRLLAAPTLEAAEAGGYVLDGFPRTVSQAEEAYRIARQFDDVELQAVVHLRVSRPELRRRLLARAKVEGRSDDNEETISHRLDVYDEETKPMLAFYSERGLVVDIDGEQPVDRVFADIVDAVDGVRAGRR